MSLTKSKIKELIDNRHKIPDEFWVRATAAEFAVWIVDQEDGTAGSYETSQERLGITKDGNILWGFSSGCSCWGGWSDDDYCPTKSYKEFELADFDKNRTEPSEWSEEKLAEWEESAAARVDDLLYMISDNPDPKRVLTLRNSEIRRYMIKRIGYENIKDSVDATVLHTDGDSELIEMVINGEKERYVKVKDSSTEREYLLYVPINMTTCKQGIAWTFGLSEREYNPIIET